MIIQSYARHNTNTNDIAFTIDKDDLDKTLEILDNAKGELFDYNRSVLFFDCPYYQPERAAEVVYKDEMGDLEHVVLIQALSQLKHWMLCGYQSGNVQGWQSRVYGVLDCFKDIRKVDLGMKHRPSGSRKAEADDPHEILWIRK